MADVKTMKKVLEELKAIHYHLERLEIFYRIVNRIKEDSQTGVWIESKKED